MTTLKWLFFFIFVVIMDEKIFVSSAFCNNAAGNYTRNSTYRANLESILNLMSTNVDINGFYNATVGRDRDTVYGTVLCRGDLQLDECRKCAREASSELIRDCPNQMKADTILEFCNLRISNESLTGVLSTSPSVYWWNPGNASSPATFNRDLGELLVDLRGQASSGGSLRKVAAANKNTSDFVTIFCLLQCTPDLSPRDCVNCLQGAAENIPNFCEDKRGCRVLRPSCILRYETYSFYNESRLQELEIKTPSQSPPPPQTLLPSLPSPDTTGEGDDNSSRTIIIIVVSVSGSIAIIACIVIAFIINRKKRKTYEVADSMEDITADSLQFDFNDIKAATNDFSTANKLGRGGFGDVYKGKLIDGQDIAVKRLSKDSGQGDYEFKNEVLLISKLQHRNLVRLLGFSIGGDEKLLVYEYVHNSSLDKFIFDRIKRALLTWETRYKIILGITKGLLYLHEDSRFMIIHRDLKPSNVLLDEKMNPKITDFGMARLFMADATQDNTSRVVGTYGYMAPEYAMHGIFSVKSDVFSFGVLVLELISGRRCNSFDNPNNMDLLNFTWSCWNQRRTAELIDPTLNIGAGSRDVLRCIHIGLLCVQENASDRPTMASIALMLSSFSVTLSVPSKPAFFVPRSYGLDQGSRGFSTESSNKSDRPQVSNNDVSITDLYPR